MAMVRWTHADPFFRPWQDFFRFSGASEDPWPRSWSRASQPSLNVWSNGSQAVVTVQLPGINPEELDLSLDGNTLTVRGERKELELGEGESVHRRERRFGSFARTVELPFEVENEEVSARYVHGVLEVTLPRAESNAPRKIQVVS